MKANELMVGDYVKFTNKYPEKELRGKVAVVVGIRGRIDVRTINDNKYHESEHPAYFEPTPLTEGILVKNGFSTGKTISGTELFTCEVTHQLAGDGFEIQRITVYPKWICYIETATTIVRTGITYVHQLQHLLRLCGIKKTIEL